MTENSNSLTAGIIFGYVIQKFFCSQVVLCGSVSEKFIFFRAEKFFYLFGVFVVLIKIFLGAAVIAVGAATFYNFGANMNCRFVGLCIANTCRSFKGTKQRAGNISVNFNVFQLLPKRFALFLTRFGKVAVAAVTVTDIVVICLSVANKKNF